MALFGFSNKKYRQQTVQLIDETIAELIPQYINSIQPDDGELDEDIEKLRNIFSAQVYERSLEKAANSNSEMSDRIGYLRYKSSDSDKSIGSAYLFILNALSGKKATAEDAKQAVKLSTDFVLYFDNIIHPSLKKNTIDFDKLFEVCTQMQSELLQLKIQNIGEDELLAVLHGITCFYITFSFNTDKDLSSLDKIYVNTLLESGMTEAQISSLLEVSGSAYNTCIQTAESIVYNYDSASSDQIFNISAEYAILSAVSLDEPDPMLSFKMMSFASYLYDAVYN